MANAEAFIHHLQNVIAALQAENAEVHHDFEQLLQIHQAAHNPPQPDYEVEQEVSGMDYEDQLPEA